MRKLIPPGAILVPDNAQLKFQGEIFDVYQWPQELYDGTSVIFEMLKRDDTVAAICVVDDKIIVIDDEQPHSGARMSFPGGRIDPEDESAEAAIKREVSEETGYDFKQWRLIKVDQPSRKIEWFTYLFLAWDAYDKHDQKLDAGEKITVFTEPFEEVKSRVLNKEGFLGNSVDVFEELSSLKDLLSTDEASGESVER